MPVNQRVIQTSTAPVIEFDPEVSAWYIRFSKAKVVRTLSEDAPGPVVTIDLDARGKVVGVELIGIKEFNILEALKMAGVEAPDVDMTAARYVSVGHSDLAMA